MKRLFTLLAVILAVNVANAQIAVSPDTVYIELIDGQLVDGYFNISNNSTGDVDVQWEILSNTMDPNYEQQFCDCFGCYSNEFAPLPDSGNCSFTSGQRQDWKFQVNPKGNSIEEGVVMLKIEDLTNGAADTIAVITRKPNSLNEVSSLNGVSFYPNPVKDELVVNVSQSEAAQVTITDLKGSVLKTETVVGMSQLNVSNLEQGVYILTIENQGQVAASRFVKM